MAAMTPGPDDTPEGNASRIRPADLSQRKPHRFSRVPDAATCAALARDLDILDVKKLRFEGVLRPVGRHDWDLQAQLGATVVQACVATLAPVTTRIDEPLTRRFRTDLAEVEPDTDTEMPHDDTLEPLPAVIDLDAILTEALSLVLPAYPRADGAAPEQTVFTEPGKAPMTDQDARPFAGLAALRQKLAPDDPQD
jgi:uncharacterized metal-binding protein YceD (DUF177 family)